MGDRSSAWILTCESWLDDDAYIVLPVNPTQLNLNFGIRTSNELTRAAQVFYYWRNLFADGPGSLFSKPVISMNVPSGNIIPSFDPAVVLECMNIVNERTVISQGDVELESLRQEWNPKLTPYMRMLPPLENARDCITYKDYHLVTKVLPENHANPHGYQSKYSKVPVGIQNLYMMYSLIDERRIRRDTNTGMQADNRAVLVLSTLVFPRLTLYGFFSESGLSYTSSAEDPGQFNMAFDFIVTDTYPKLSTGNWASLAQEYQRNIGSSATTADALKTQASRKK